VANARACLTSFFIGDEEKCFYIIFATGFVKVIKPFFFASDIEVK
jgi:hypothetical protein